VIGCNDKAAEVFIVFSTPTLMYGKILSFVVSLQHFISFMLKSADYLKNAREMNMYEL
jgi:hypothetical protein